MTNSNWRDEYTRRQLKADEAISIIQPQDKVFLAPFCNERCTELLAIVHPAFKEKLQWKLKQVVS